MQAGFGFLTCGFVPMSGWTGQKIMHIRSLRLHRRAKKFNLPVSKQLGLLINLPGCPQATRTIRNSETNNAKIDQHSDYYTNIYCCK